MSSDPFDVTQGEREAPIRERSGADWRPRLLDALLLTFSIVAVPILVNETFYRDDWLAPVLAWTLMPTLLLLRGRCSLEVRGTVFVSMLLLLGIWAAWTAGLMGSGRIFEAAAVITGGLLLGRRAGIALFAIGCVATAFTGWAAVTGQHAFAPPFDAVENTRALWASHLGTFVITVGTLLTSVLYVIETLQRLHEDIRHEVREREVVERAEREAARHMRFLADNAGDSLWTMDLDFRLTYVSESAERMRGFTAAELAEMGIAGALAVDSAETVRAMLADELARDAEADPDRTTRFETRLTTRDGTGVDVEIKVSFLRDDSGRPIGLIGVTRDITDRRRLEAAMDLVIRGARPTGQGAFFDSLTENLAAVLGVRTVLLAAAGGEGDGALHLLSVYRDGHHDRAFEAPLAGSPCETVLREGQCYVPAGVALRYPDSPLPGLAGREGCIGVPLLDAEGGRIGALLCLDDSRLEDPRLSEDLLTIFSAHASLELSRQRAEAEREVIGQQLRQSQKLESIGQLSGGIAHDFNNLLVVIQGYAELAEASADDPDTLEDSLLNIRAATERAAALTRQLLSFSRRQVMDTRALDLGEQLRAVDGMLRRLLPEIIEYRLEVEAPLVVDADAGQLEQAVVNLAVNARDAMPEGGRLTVSVAAVEVDGALREKFPDARPGRHALLRVADSGSGIDLADRSKIFEPFFTTKPEGMGTGLGLSVVFGIVRQHGGFIDLESAPGRGTEFRVYLPLREGPADEAGPEAPGSVVASGRETILLVEDEPAVRRLATRFLTGAGYSVVEAEDGESAVEQFRAHRERISLAVLDVVLPKTNGRLVMEQILAIEPGLRVLFVSGYAADGIHTDFILEKDLVLLAKPYSRDQLLSRVREVLDAVPAERPASPCAAETAAG